MDFFLSIYLSLEETDDEEQKTGVDTSRTGRHAEETKACTYT